MRSKHDYQYRSTGTQGGQVRQSGNPQFDTRMAHLNRANGLILSGVVLATYIQLDGAAAFPPGILERQAAIYCDVLIYGSAASQQGGVLRQVLVAQSTGLHTGQVWKPRATTINFHTQNLDASLVAMDPRDLDGDHVLIQFLEDNLSKPVITARLPHPQTGIGNESLPEAGHRQRLQLSDGDPQFWKHHGTFFGVDDSGNFLVDTTRSHNGQYNADGSEQPANDSTHGDVHMRVNSHDKFVVEGLDKDAANQKFLLQVEDGKLTVQMGNDPAKSLVLDETAGTLTIKLGSNTKTISFDGSIFTVEAGDPTHKMVLDQTSLNVKAGGDTLKAELVGALAKLTVGTGTDFPISFTAFKAWWTTVAGLISGHTHPLSGSDSNGDTLSSGSATASLGLSTLATAPPVDPALKAAHVEFPPGPV